MKETSPQNTDNPSEMDATTIANAAIDSSALEAKSAAATAAQADANDEVVAVSAKTLRIVPWIIGISFFMQMLDGTILNTALPPIAKALGESPLRMQATVISYMITVALLIPASGWLADRFGTKKTFFASIIVFCLGSIFCAMSTTLHALVAGRIVQAVGGALMMPVGRLALFRIVPRHDLVRVMNFIVIPGLIGPLIGPTLGGLFVQYASWHWIFLINIPVGLIGCILTWRYMPSLQIVKSARFDWFGFIMFGVAMVALSLAVEGVGELNLPAAINIGLALLGATCLFAYVFYASRVKNPLLSLNVFKVRSFSVGIAGNLFSRLGTGAMPFLTPLLFQLGLGFSPAKAGMTMIPTAVGAILAKPFVTNLVYRFGFRKMLVVNTLLLGAMIASFSTITPQTNYYALLLQLTLYGVINSTQFSLMNTATMFELSQAQAGGGNSILSIMMQLSISFGVSCGAMLLNLFTDWQGTAAISNDTLLSAFRYTFMCAGIFSIFASATFYFMPGEIGKDLREKNT